MEFFLSVFITQTKSNNERGPNRGTWLEKEQFLYSANQQYHSTAGTVSLAFGCIHNLKG